MSPFAVQQSIKNAPRHKFSHGGPPRITRSTILHLTADLEMTPEAREVVDLAVQAHRLGWRPVVASAGGALVLEAERAAVRHTRIPLNRGNLWARWRSRAHLEALFQRERPNLIHAHGFDMLAPACGLSLLHRLPLLIDLTQPAQPTKERLKLLQTAIQRRAWFRVPSAFMAEHLRNQHQLDTGFLYHVPTGTDLQWFDAAHVSPERLQKLEDLWRLPEQATIIIMATPLAPGNGHRQLLEALTRIQRHDVFTVLVGDDRQEPGTRLEIEKLVTAHGLEGRVVMPETCTDWPAACWLATLVVATNTAPRGNAPELLHAQAMGRPVIVTECGANTELVRGGETAWVVPPDNVDLLTQALDEAVRMTEVQRIDLALRARAFITETFPQEAWCRAMTDLYGGMLGYPASAQAL